MGSRGGGRKGLNEHSRLPRRLGASANYSMNYSVNQSSTRQVRNKCERGRNSWQTRYTRFASNRISAVAHEFKLLSIRSIFLPAFSSDNCAKARQRGKFLLRCGGGGVHELIDDRNFARTTRHPSGHLVDGWIIRKRQTSGTR